MKALIATVCLVLSACATCPGGGVCPASFMHSSPTHYCYYTDPTCASDRNTVYMHSPEDIALRAAARSYDDCRTNAVSLSDFKLCDDEYVKNTK